MQNFKTQHLKKGDVKQIYKQILNDVLDIHLYGADSEKVQNAIGLYVNYVANRRGVPCEYSFEPLSSKSRKDGEKLVDCLTGGVRVGSANVRDKKLRFNDLLLTADNFEDFAFVVQAIEHEFQHLWFEQNPQEFFTFETPNGIKTEFHTHKDALSTIKAKAQQLLPSGLTSDADITMFDVFSRSLYHFDDNEKYARLVAVEGARQFLTDMQKTAGKMAGKQIASEIKRITQNYLLDEQTKSQQEWEIISELKPDMHKLMFKLFKHAKQNNDLELVSAIAETQDIAQLYNPAIFAHIESFAKQHNHLETLLHLDNCKHARPNAEKAKQHYMEYVKNHTGQISLLSNYSIETKKQWIKQASLAPVVVAKEIEEKPKRRVFGRRFKSMQEPSVQESTADLSKEVHGISHVAESFLKRRENRMSSQPKHEQNNDYYQ